MGEILRLGESRDQQDGGEICHHPNPPADCAGLLHKYFLLLNCQWGAVEFLGQPKLSRHERACGECIERTKAGDMPGDASAERYNDSVACAGDRKSVV